LLQFLHVVTIFTRCFKNLLQIVRNFYALSLLLMTALPEERLRPDSGVQSEPGQQEEGALSTHSGSHEQGALRTFFQGDQFMKKMSKIYPNPFLFKIIELFYRGKVAQKFRLLL
jgi:hypothetical protein